MKVARQAGADPRQANAQHSTPLMAAAGLGCLAPGEEAGTEDEALEAVKLAIELGNDVNAVDDNGETAMHGAAYKSLPKVVQLLADKGPTSRSGTGRTSTGGRRWRSREGHRPGNFKPSPETIAAIEAAVRARRSSAGKELVDRKPRGVRSALIGRSLMSQGCFREITLPANHLIVAAALELAVVGYLANSGAPQACMCDAAESLSFVVLAGQSGSTTQGSQGVDRLHSLPRFGATRGKPPWPAISPFRIGLPGCRTWLANGGGRIGRFW